MNSATKTWIIVLRSCGSVRSFYIQAVSAQDALSKAIIAPWETVWYVQPSTNGGL